jgi:hypothetical protein
MVKYSLIPTINMKNWTVESERMPSPEIFSQFCEVQEMVLNVKRHEDCTRKSETSKKIVEKGCQPSDRVLKTGCGGGHALKASCKCM